MGPMHWITIIATDWDEPEFEFHLNRRDAEDYAVRIFRQYLQLKTLTFAELNDMCSPATIGGLRISSFQRAMGI